jgi:plasmid stabilization system protein ParE
MVTVWSKRAAAELQKAYKYIYQFSPQNAAKVRDEIIDMTLDLVKNPEMFPPDKWKKENNGKWRAFEKYHYRISYFISSTEIRIVRMRHTSRTPLNY